MNTDPRVELLEAMWREESIRERLYALVCEWSAGRDERAGEIAELERMWALPC